MNEGNRKHSCPLCDEEIRRLEARVAETEGVERAEALMELAHAAHFDGKWELVLGAVSACLDLLPRGEFPRLEADAESGSACALAELERHEEAMPHSIRAREIYASLGDAHSVAWCIQVEGGSALALGRSDVGIALLEEAAEKFRSLGEVADSSFCHLEVARALERALDYRAIGQFDTAKDGFAAVGTSVMVGACEMEAGLALSHKRNMESEALDRFSKAALILEASGEREYAARCIAGAGTMQHRLGCPAEAEKLLRKARPILAKLSSSDVIAECDKDWGHALNKLGRYKLGASKLRSALKVFRKLGDEVEVAACEDYLGMSLQGLGQFDEAIEHHRRAKEIFARHEMTRDADMCEYYLELALEGLGNQTAPQESAQVIPLRRRKK